MKLTPIRAFLLWWGLVSTVMMTAEHFQSALGPAVFYPLTEWPLFLSIPVIAGLIMWDVRSRSGKVPPAGLCPRCGYDLRATPSRCPECGLEIPPPIC